MPARKSIFRQPGAKHFQLVYRSQRDPLIHDQDAPQHVFKSFERENIKKGKSRTDLETLLSPSDLQKDTSRNVGEAALYGVYYDDTSYDYMQHLRTYGAQEDGVESILIEASISKKNKGSKKANDLTLPQEVLPSMSEVPRNHESQEAIPTSIAGFQPDMDPHLRQVLEALEDDAFVDDDLADNFFEELIEDGERATDDEVDFEYDETSIVQNENPGPGDEGEIIAKEPEWEKMFAEFKHRHTAEGRDTSSDDEFLSEGDDTVGGLPRISVAGGKVKRRREGSSDASGYSMSSSSMYRNEALQTLDQRFDQIIDKEYPEEEDGRPLTPSDEDETDDVPELITSREDFDAMVNEFLHDYEILGRKMKPKLPGDSAAGKLDTIRRAMGHDSRVQWVNEDEDDNILDLTAFDVTLKEDRWDCETILTTYSNVGNHPHIIRVSNSKAVPKIILDPRTGLPLVPGSLSGSTRKPATNLVNNVEDGFDGSGTEATATKHITTSRPRGESKEEKKARKAAVRREKQVRRTEKRVIRERFETELKFQKRVLASKTQQVKQL